MRLADNQLAGRSSGYPPASHTPRNGRGAAKLKKLGLIGRLLLTSDGTVTTMLEQIVGEQIVTARLDQSMAPVDQETAALMLFPAASLVTRTTHLVGATSGTIFVRAKSVFSQSAMPALVRADLLTTDEPIGRLLRRHRVESFREILSIHIPEHSYPMEPSRRYLIFIGGLPALLIEESFTAECFQFYV
jgi:chorismate-pyruvate lyase